MPIKEFECETCHHKFEEILGINEPVPTVCPKCGKAPLKQLLSTFRIAGMSKKSSDAEDLPGGEGLDDAGMGDMGGGMDAGGMGDDFGGGDDLGDMGGDMGGDLGGGERSPEGQQPGDLGDAGGNGEE